MYKLLKQTKQVAYMYLEIYYVCMGLTIIK